MSKRPLLALYGLAHFWVDLSCAFLVFRTLAGQPDPAMCLLFYNFCAFALQMPLGLLADRLDRNGVVAAGGCLLVAAAYILPTPLAMAVAAGTGNALFHLGGGIDTLNVSEKKATALGVFVSPGALGLFIGTAWGKGTFPKLWLGAAGLLILAAAILLLCRKTFGSLRSGNVPLDPTPVGGYAPLLPLFLVVVLRSYMGMNQSFPWRGEGRWAVILTLALVLGKAAGGFLMDRLNPRKTSALTLSAAAVFYLLGEVPLMGTAAVFLFNMTMPITLWAAAKVMPGSKGFAFGLLTFALFIGYLPVWLGIPSLLTESWACAAVSLLSLALLRRPLGKEAVVC